MAKKLAGKRIRTVETVEETPQETVGGPLEEMDQEVAEIIEGEERIDDEIEELIGGEDREGLVKLFRWNETGKRWKMVPSMSRQGFTRDLVAEAWGGGRYLMKVYKGKAYKGSKTFEIDDAVKPRQQVVVPVGTGEGNAPSWLAATLDKMGEAIKAMAERPVPTPPAPPDAMAMIEKLAVTMRALTPPPVAVAPPADFEKQLGIIEKMVTVGTSIVEARGGNEGGSSDSYMGVVKELARPVIELVKTQAEREQLRHGPRARDLPSPSSAPALPAATGGPPMPWLMEIQRWLPLIQKRQQKGLDAESTAFFVLDELSEGTLAALADLAAQPDFETQVQKLLPAEMHVNPAWVADFLQAVKDYLFEEDEPPVEVEESFNLDAEAERRLAKLRDKPDEPPAQPPAQEL